MRQKIFLDRLKLALRLAAERDQGRRTVFTNGCFDLLHPGHVNYLQAARQMADRLIVGLNSDESISRLKGKNRPIMPESARAELLAALEVVDYVIVFPEDDPYELIRVLEPDILVKGGDWPVSDIIGADLVQARGGEVFSLPLVEGFSTTSIVNKIISLNG